jgi:hypothetical protein
LGDVLTLGAKVQASILDVDVVLAGGVALELVVAAAVAVDVDLPRGGVQRTVELVGED